MKRLIFVDDEPKVLQGLQRQLHGMRHEWDMKFAASGAEALDYMRSSPVDVLVTDMLMPFMDGAQLLTEVMKRHPQTMRLVLSGHADQEAVLRLVGPAHQYLSKPCNAEELRGAITRVLAIRELLASPPLKQLVSRIKCLPSLPALHTEVSAELRKADPDLDRISRLISRDLGMSTKILQLVNSSFFGLPQPAADVREALLYLGVATVRALVLSIQVFSQFDQRKLRSFPIEALSQHSWKTSVFARRIAEVERCATKIDDQCFLAGLLHDLGHLVLVAGLGEQYLRVLESTHDSGKSVCAAEQAEFGATHAEVGAYLLGLWGLPAPVIEAVALHHQPAACSVHGFSPVVAVHAADVLASDPAGAHPEPPQHQLDTAHLAFLGLDSRVDEWKDLCLNLCPN